MKTTQYRLNVTEEKQRNVKAKIWRTQNNSKGQEESNKGPEKLIDKKVNHGRPNDTGNNNRRPEYDQEANERLMKEENSGPKKVKKTRDQKFEKTTKRFNNHTEDKMKEI